MGEEVGEERRRKRRWKNGNEVGDLDFHYGC